MKADSLRNLVVSLADRTRLGRVIDVLVEPEAPRVEALLLESGTGRLARRLVLPLGAIRSIGRDTITIERAELVQPLGEGGALTPLSALTSLPVGSSDGDYLGDLAGLEFDAGSGEILGLEVRRAGLLGVGTTICQLGPRAIRALGDRMVTVEPGQLGPG